MNPLRNTIMQRSKPVIRKAGEVEGIGPVFVRVATPAERQELLRLAGVSVKGKDDAVIPDPDKFAALCISRLAVDAQGVRVWGDDDVATLLGLSVDDAYWVTVGPAAMAALGPIGAGAEERIKELEKQLAEAKAEQAAKAEVRGN